MTVVDRKAEAVRWHRMETEEVIAELGTSAHGLSSSEAHRRLLESGLNILEEKKAKPPVMIFISQFGDLMIIILIVAAVISGFIGEISDTIAIIVIVALNAVIGFIQEYRAEKAMAALKEMAAPSAIALRDGKVSVVAASEIVKGDVVIIEAGQIVPADLRLVETAFLRVNEAALTGESVPVEKVTHALQDHDLPVGDRRNMAYKGTFATYGRGTGVVVSTGMDTELGRIATMLQQEEEVKTPLQRRLAVFGRRLAFAVMAICVIVFVVGVVRGTEPVLMLLTAISLAVAAIPEALPAVITISLALGARKLARQNALIRKLPAVETLGSVTYICSDKTGTLTMNRMTVEKVYVDGKVLDAAMAEGSAESLMSSVFQDSPIPLFFAALSLNNDAETGAGDVIMGDPTEIALRNIAQKYGFDRKGLESVLPRAAEIPFDSERKCMTTFHRMHKGYVSFTKGALDVLLEASVNVLTSRGLKVVDADEVRRVNEAMAAEGLRVICVATRRWDAIPAQMSPEDVEKGLTILGLAAMMDPPREEAERAVSSCRKAGITPVMITGDHPVTAKAVAARIGITGAEPKAVITGRELERLSMEEFEERVDHIRVYARVAPEQKLKIVKALQDRGQFVAMTGDGVNDAPALKRADIGIAMGITGTDVSKEAAHMVLLDDNFATIVRAVGEGRKIYDNIRKFIRYLLTTNSGEIWTLFLAPLAGMPVPLLPIHILWINLVTDGLPALALSVEPAEGDAMQRPPRDPNESIFAGGLGIHAVWVGLLMGGIVLLVQALAIGTRHGNWQTMVFTTLCLTQLGHVLAIRSEKQSLFTIGLFSNAALFGAVALTLVLQLATVYMPYLNRIFKTQPLSPGELLLVLVLSSVVFIAVEIEKLIKRRRAAVSIR